jgi:hypothetical protein
MRTRPTAAVANIVAVAVGGLGLKTVVGCLMVVNKSRR